MRMVKPRTISQAIWRRRNAWPERDESAPAVSDRAGPPLGDMDAGARLLRAAVPCRTWRAPEASSALRDWAAEWRRTGKSGRDIDMACFNYVIN